MKKKIVPITLLSCFSFNQLQAATLLSITQSHICNIVPVGAHTAYLPSHCLSSSLDRGDYIVLDDGNFIEIDAFHSNKESDFATISTKQSFKKYYKIKDLDSGEIQIAVDKPDRRWHFDQSYMFDADKSKALLFYDFQTEGGDSGSPILQHGNVVGMHLGKTIAGENKPAKGLALLLFSANNIRMSEVRKIAYTPQNPAALAAAGAWCSANAQACATAMASLMAFGGVVVSKSVDIVIEYMRQRGARDLDKTKDKLAQCEVDKDAMKAVLNEIYNNNPNNSHALQIGNSDPLTMENPGWQREADDLLNRFGGGDYQPKGVVTIGEYDLPLHTESTRGENAVGALAYLSALAVVDAFQNSNQRAPTPQEFRQGMSVVWDGKTLPEVANYAKNGKWDSAVKQPPIKCEKIYNCDHEM